MNGLIEAAGALLDPRRLSAAWLPVVGFLLGLLAIVIGALGAVDSLSTWSALGGAGQVLVVAGFLVSSVIVAAVLDARRISFTRMLEGYLPRRLEPLAVRLRRRHETLRAALPPVERRRRYPRGEVRATRIGNTIAAAEEHGARYGIDTVAAWPRLYPTLPEPFLAAFGAAAGSLHTMSTLCVLGGTFATLGGLVAVMLLPWWGTLLCVTAGGMVAVAAYQGAARAALPYAALIRSAYDVHRWALLSAMGLRLPTSFEAEFAQWTQLKKLWELGLPDSGGSIAMRYPLPAGVTTEPSAPETSVGLGDGIPTVEADAESSGPPREGTSERGPRVRIALLALALVVTALLVGMTAVRGKLVTVIPDHGNELRASTDLPAYRSLTCTDVLDGGGPPRPGDVVGRYPLETLRRGDPIRRDRLGPAVGPLGGRLVTTLSTSTTTAQRAIARGTMVSVVLVPPASPSGPAPAVLVPDLLVLDVLGTAPAAVVVAAPPERLAALQRPGTLTILLDPTVTVPPSAPANPARCP
ncbi:hypothetical protein [Actinomycetospora soli]|uniref:hypothetical protein n=1 Tax=Actinomycetospora soli TaxID=2893887 RepID=UPI001E2C94D8|nr:hypothetical protein [Actinomycetospora soli]MCD2187820.1 hypothetical protein [Actinomycetospora soli]